METVEEFSGIGELCMIVYEVFEPGLLQVEPYGFDDRIGWDTHIVTIDGNAVGFTNGPVSANMPE